MVCQHLQRNICAPSGVGTNAKAGFLRRISGISRDEGDARLLGPAPERIIPCAFGVTNALGYGFVEQPSENALALEMRKCALGTVQQRGTIILYQRAQILTGRPVNICVMAARASTRVRVGPATHVFD
jgi:predicted outer membrane lipoprotein